MSGEDLLSLLAAPDPSRTLMVVDAIYLAALVAICAIVVVVDARERIIPDWCNGAIAALGLAFMGRDGWDAALAAIVQGLLAFMAFWIFRALYRALRGRHGLGLGDVKFLGAGGIWVGLGAIPALILVASVTALAFLGLQRLRGHALSGGHALPFGPFLVLGFLAVLTPLVL